MENLQNLLIGLFTIIIGLALVFLGYGIWRIALVIGGFLLGYTLGAGLVNPDQWFLALLLGVVLAVVVGVLAYFLWSIAIVIAGAVFGAAIGAGVAAAIPWVTSDSGIISQGIYIAIVLVGLVLGGVLAFFLKDLFMVVVTALAGALGAFNGLILILPFLSFITQPTSTIAAIVAIVLVGGLTIIGALVQISLYSSRFNGQLYFEERTA